MQIVIVSTVDAGYKNMPVIRIPLGEENMFV